MGCDGDVEFGEFFEYLGAASVHPARSATMQTSDIRLMIQSDDQICRLDCKQERSEGEVLWTSCKMEHVIVAKKKIVRQGTRNIAIDFNALLTGQIDSQFLM
jgi:hypothetical protein